MLCSTKSLAIMPLALTLSIGAAVVVAAPAKASTAQDTVDVDSLIAAYHQAVLDHDGARLAALFVPEGSAWFSVLSDEAFPRARAKNANASKLRSGSVKGFVTMVSTSKTQLNPEHSDLRVESDGAIATVTFKFRFLVDGKEQNRGSESWQVVKGAQGWRIASIVYSSTPLQL